MLNAEVRMTKKWIINIPKIICHQERTLQGPMQGLADAVKDFKQKSRRKCKIAVDFPTLCLRRKKGNFLASGGRVAPD